MKINVTNIPAITAALVRVNGTARTCDIVQAAQNAEQQLINLGFNLRQRKGATVSYRGATFSYRYGSTEAKLVRGSSSWFVVELGTSNWPKAIMGTFLTLSPEQDKIEVDRFRSFYGASV